MSSAFSPANCRRSRHSRRSTQPPRGRYWPSPFRMLTEDERELLFNYYLASHDEAWRSQLAALGRRAAS